MAPLPKRKHSTKRKGIRLAQRAKTAVGLVDCIKCGRKKLPHRICKRCGSKN